MLNVFATAPVIFGVGVPMKTNGACAHATPACLHRRRRARSSRASVVGIAIRRNDARG